MGWGASNTMGLCVSPAQRSPGAELGKLAAGVRPGIHLPGESLPAPSQDAQCVCVWGGRQAPPSPSLQSRMGATQGDRDPGRQPPSKLGSSMERPVVPIT